MAERRRLTIALDGATGNLLAWLSKTCDTPEGVIINKLLGAHLHELWEYRTWLEKQEPGSRNWELGTHLISNYGPDDLVTAIKRIDPTYKTLEEQLRPNKSNAKGDAE
ncbi:hypothetical protein [Cupriavidus neocaledonicus]|uniref:Uncharacterized protein n=1 Tax=Cupriavidus neocaledonicus TaxID=1040979 RepID=A0A375H3Y0_9BURK|nr:hypothetical protein [Cupriavidus neocaledonicus]SOZ37020.1 hypothetical protein CBM2605_A60264 [Cupriavidus neocaledonicus]SPD45598.1 protein of unknown function [Cupriavidus neocaledonicus]